MLAMSKVVIVKRVLLGIGILLLLLQSGTLLRAQDGKIAIPLDLKGSGVVSDHVVKRSLYFATDDAPVSLGPTGIGSISSGGSVKIPFRVDTPGDYYLVFTYGLAVDRRLIDVSIDGKAPVDAWSNVELWPTSPDYPW